MTDLVSIRLLPYNNYTITVQRSDLVHLFPTSLFARTLEQDPAATEIEISSPVVTPEILNELHTLYTTRRYEEQDYRAAAGYLNLPILTVIRDPELMGQVKEEGINIVELDLDEYETLMEVAILQSQTDMIDYLLAAMPEEMGSEVIEDKSTPDQRLLALAILRNNVYAVKNITRDHHVDPLDARFGSQINPDANTFDSKIKGDYKTDYGSDVLHQIDRQFTHPVWGYIGFKLLTVDPPSPEMITLLLSTVSDLSTAVEIFNWVRVDYSHRNLKADYGDLGNQDIVYILRALGDGLSGDQIDHIFDTLLINGSGTLHQGVENTLLKLPNILDRTETKISLLDALVTRGRARVRHYLNLLPPLSPRLQRAYMNWSAFPVGM